MDLSSNAEVALVFSRMNAGPTLWTSVPSVRPDRAAGVRLTISTLEELEDSHTGARKMATKFALISRLSFPFSDTFKDALLMRDLDNPSRFFIWPTCFSVNAFIWRYSKKVEASRRAISNTSNRRTEQFFARPSHAIHADRLQLWNSGK